jgi:hypothetical protein
MRKRMMLGVAFGLASIAAGGADAHQPSVRAIWMPLRTQKH